MIAPVSTRLSRYAWFVLACNVLVILWGAYVRATGSGAGCGQHWPLCNGEIIPRAPTSMMLIEFAHRASSGLALVAVVVLVAWVRRSFPAGHPARRGAVLSLAFILTEAVLGAGLVLFQLVADNATLARAMAMAAHLANTFMLLACLTLTAHWVSGGADISIRGRGTLGWIIAAALLGVLGVGKSGAVAALGDTLYPPASLAQGLLADLSASATVLIRLRILHPMLAVTVGIVLLAGASRIPLPPGDRVGRAARRALVGLVGIQLVAGFANVWLLAPVWLQLVHLLLADALWISMVVLAASALAALPAGEASGDRAYGLRAPLET
jgi:cytochrome c oxidase assembly protein subunit 15